MLLLMWVLELEALLMVTGSTILVLVLFMRDTPSVLTFEENLLTTAVGISLFAEVLPPLFLQ